MPSPDLARLPRVDRVVARPELEPAKKRLGLRVATRLVREALAAARSRLLRAEAGGSGAELPDEAQVARAAATLASALLAGRARRVINATGILLHTNLGRAPLPASAVRAVAESAGGYVSLEIDLATGRRGRRAGFAEDALVELTGADAALIVNNGAAAILLLLTAVAAGKVVLVSRGELVEIGGGFRVPEVMERSGARLVEVGSTNRTRVADYERALDAHPEAAAILRVHQANFRQVGFVERPTVAELAELAARRRVLLLEDQGSGSLDPVEDLGMDEEPSPAASIAAGVDAITFSTDKLLGGPQGGVIAGREGLVQKSRRDPLARALRLGRLPLVALEATLEVWLAKGPGGIPALARARTGLSALTARAERWEHALAAAGFPCEVVETEAELGGGAQPGRPLPSRGLRVPHPRPERLAAQLRGCDPAVLARVEERAVVLDAIAVPEGEEAELIVALLAVLVASEFPNPGTGG